MDMRPSPPPLRLLEKPLRHAPPLRPAVQPRAHGWWQRLFGALAR
jgi:hypothetical protein